MNEEDQRKYSEAVSFVQWLVAQPPTFLQAHKELIPKLEQALRSMMPRLEEQLVTLGQQREECERSRDLLTQEEEGLLTKIQRLEGLEHLHGLIPQLRESLGDIRSAKAQIEDALRHLADSEGQVRASLAAGQMLLHASDMLSTTPKR